MYRGICKICESFFEKRTKEQNICDKCYEKDRKRYEIVKEYLLQNKDASIMNIYIDTKIPIKTIKRYIAEEKLEIIDC